MAEMSLTTMKSKRNSWQEFCHSSFDVNLLFLKEYNAENNLGISGYKLMEMAN